jgi:hypothetical protein
VADIFKEVNGSVTVIEAVHKVSSVTARIQQTMGLGSVGSGVLVSKSGKLITSAHLVETADQIKVKLLSGEIVGARVAASAPFADISLLQLESVPEHVSVAKLGDSEKVQVGDEVFVVGAPYGLSHTLTVGHISARHRPNTVSGGFETAEFFQRGLAMKWVEIISLRSPANIDTRFADELLKEVSESDSETDTPKHLVEIRVYHHSVVETDLSVHIYWKSESGSEDKSPLGLRFFYGLKNLGLLNHSVWVETAAVEFPLSYGNSKPRA